MHPYFEIIAEMNELHGSVEPTSNDDVKWSRLVHNSSVSLSDASLMSVSPKVAPNWASLILGPRPMPLPAPVTIMTLSLKDGAIMKTESAEIYVVNR